MISRFPRWIPLFALTSLACHPGGSSHADDPPSSSAPTDSQAPALAWKPAPALYPGQNVTLELEASDDQGPVFVELFADGASLGLKDAAPFAWSYLPSKLPGETQTFAAKASDGAGNTTELAPIDLVVAWGGSGEIATSPWKEASPAVLRMEYSIAANPAWSDPTLLVSEDGGATLQQGSLVGAGELGSGSFFLEWNSALDFGVADVAGLQAALALRDAQGVWHCSEPFSFDLKNQSRIEEYREKVFPDLEDALDHASPYFSKVLPSLAVTTLPNGIVKKSFVFDSPHFRQGGPASNVCAGCPSWKKDIWNDVPCDLYLPAAGNPENIVLLGVLTGPQTIWTPQFSLLYPEFDDGSIAGAGDPSKADTANFEECVLKTIQELNVGVLVGSFMQAGGSVPGSAPGVAICSYDEALFTGEPRWNVWVGAAEAMMRALTAAEIVQGKAPGALRFAVQGSSKHGWTSSFAAAADPRIVAAYLHVSAGMGEWGLLGQLAKQHFTPKLQTNWDLALSMLLAAGYPLHFPLNLDGMAEIPDLANFEVWHRTSDPDTQIALALLQGKLVHQQEDTGDWNFDLRARNQWFDDTLRRRYPGSAIRMGYSANGDHSNSAPQDFKNLRSFAASAFFERPRSDVEAKAETTGGVALVTAQVENPDPSKLAVAAVRLRYGFDDDDDWRQYALPAPDPGDGCTKPFSGDALVCFGTGNFFINRNFQSIPMAPTGNSGEYAASIDLAGVGTAADRHVAMYVEVEDRPAPGAPPPLTAQNRYFHSSRFFLFAK